MGSCDSIGWPTPVRLSPADGKSGTFWLDRLAVTWTNDGTGPFNLVSRGVSARPNHETLSPSWTRSLSMVPKSAYRSAAGVMVFHILNRGVARVRLFEQAADCHVFDCVLRETRDQSSMRNFPSIRPFVLVVDRRRWVVFNSGP